MRPRTATVQADADAEPQPQPRIAPTNGNKARIAKARAIEMIRAEQLHLQEGATRIIADQFGVNPSTASRWIKAINQEVAA